jgi:hypothetical protein
MAWQMDFGNGTLYFELSDETITWEDPFVVRGEG